LFEDVLIAKTFSCIQNLDAGEATIGIVVCRKPFS